MIILEYWKYQILICSYVVFFSFAALRVEFEGSITTDRVAVFGIS